MNQVSIRSSFGFSVVVFCWFISTETFAQPHMPDFMRQSAETTWSHPVHRNLKCVAYGNGIFVAIGYSTTILISKDGTNWKNRSSEITNVCANINFTTETYSAGGDTITFAGNSLPNLPSISESKTNAAVPSSYSVQLPKTPFQLRSITFGKSTFVIVGDYGEILTSHDGEQ